MKESAGRAVPEARTDGLVIQELADEVLVYDLQRHRAHCLNQTAAWVWKHCDGHATVEDLARGLQTELKTPVHEGIVWLALGQLEKDHLLNGRISRPPAVAGLSRRELVGQLGLVAAIALPLVTSIVSPTPAHAASCVDCASGTNRKAGCFCNSPEQCCSLNCNLSLSVCI